MAVTLAELVTYFRGDDSHLNKTMGDSEKSLNSFSSKAGGILKGALMGGAAAVGTAVVAAGVSAVKMAADIEDSTAKATTQLGLSADEAARFEDTMISIYGNNFGTDFDDIAQSLVAVNNQFERIGQTLPQDELQRVTESAFALRDAFGVEVSESMNAVTTLMDNFGLTSQEALGFVTSGFQRGLNSSDDFLDTIGEYSNQFAAGGASASEFFSMLETGMQGGMLGTDKAADAFKEFGIRIVDGSSTTSQALEDIGIDYEELRKGFADGSITTADAMQMVIDKIGEIEDPVERAKVGVALFGTQWEDLTEDVILGINTQKTGIGELESANEDLSAQYDTTKSRWQSASREMQAAIIPIGEALMDLGARVLPYVTNYITNTLAPAITDMAEKFASFVERWNTASGGLNPLFPGAPNAVDQFFGGNQDVIDMLKPYQPENLAVVNPVNQLPSGPPPGWVGAWNPNMTRGGTNINVQVQGNNATYENGRAVGRGINDELRMRGE